MKKLPAAFYQLPSGTEPVRDWLLKLEPADRWAIGVDIKDVEYSWPIGMPLCRSLGKGLWEVRSNISAGRIARVIFCVHNGHMTLLHGFVKKTQKTSKADMDKALNRKKDLD